MSASTAATTAPTTPTEVVLVASGDLRLSANVTCWPTQAAMEERLAEAFRAEGVTIRRGHPYDEATGHGFIDSQRYGMDIFRDIDPDAPLVVAEAVWQYTHHVLPGLTTHRGPILTIANWNGEFPGLVGLLNLNGSLVKAGIPFSTLWSRDFTDDAFRDGLRAWLRDGTVRHDTSHIRDLDTYELPGPAVELGEALAADLRRDKAIMGVFDEGCMGMFNAIVPDHLLHATGVFKERLSQSALYAAMREVSDDEAGAVRRWLDERGMTFMTGTDPVSELTDDQVLGQCRMYIAALRMADAFGCATIGIQYQQGLKDLVPASDLVEGLLNNVDRPPVAHAESGEELYAGQALPHFNEVDECAGLDGLVTARVWQGLGQPPENTLHDLRWGEHYTGPDGDGNDLDAFVWLLMISGGAPPAHFAGGYAGSSSMRQTPMFFPAGGGTLRGVGRPGEVVWSRVFVEDDALHMDIGRGAVVSLPGAETERRWQATSPEWPIVHLVTHGVSQAQMMGRHRANHIQIAYADDAMAADLALAGKAAMMRALGVAVHVCGVDTIRSA